MTTPLTPESVDIRRHFVLFTHVNLVYCEFRYFGKKFSVWESEKLFAHQFFWLCIHTHKGVKIDLIAGVLLLNANKKQQQQQREKQQKTKKKQILITPVKKHTKHSSTVVVSW